MRNVLSGFLLLLFPLRFLTICGFGFLANLLPRSLRLASILSSGCFRCMFYMDSYSVTRCAVEVQSLLDLFAFRCLYPEASQ
jgi:hypothetical protein